MKSKDELLREIESLNKEIKMHEHLYSSVCERFRELKERLKKYESVQDDLFF